MDCANGYISAARAGESDLTATGEITIAAAAPPPPVEALLASDGGTLDVTASPDGEAGPAWLLLLPVSMNPFHVRLARLSTKRTLSGIAPGDYQIYAWKGSPEAFEYANPDARQAWSSHAAGIHIGSGDHQSIAVRIVPAEAP
jgi:hypothetical protein